MGLTDKVVALGRKFPDAEIGKLTKLIQEGQSDLTITPWGDIIGETFGDDPWMFKTEPVASIC